MSLTTQELDSFLPVFDALPDKWEDSRVYLVEQLKRMSDAINIREIGYFLDEELRSGKSFIPGITIPGNNPGILRTVMRKVIITGALIAGVNPPKLHGIVFDANITLIHLWVSATNSIALTAITMSNPQNVTMDATNINITSPGAFDRSFAFVEYLQEL